MPGRKRLECDRRCRRSHGLRSGEQVTAGDSMNFEPGSSAELNGGKRFTSTELLKCREMIFALPRETVAERSASARQVPETSACKHGTIAFLLESNPNRVRSVGSD